MSDVARRRERSSGELFTLDEHGEPTDRALHDEILDNPEAERVIAAQAIERAVAHGMDRASIRPACDSCRHEDARFLKKSHRATDVHPED